MSEDKKSPNAIPFRVFEVEKMSIFPAAMCPIEGLEAACDALQECGASIFAIYPIPLSAKASPIAPVRHIEGVRIIISCPKSKKLDVLKAIKKQAGIVGE